MNLNMMNKISAPATAKILILIIVIPELSGDIKRNL